MTPEALVSWQVADGEDTLWTPDARESGAGVKKRGLEFIKWLVQRPEHKIAVVSHSSFLFFLFANFGRDCSEPIQVWAFKSLVSHHSEA